MNLRLKNLRSKLKERNLDALLVSNAFNRQYISGFTGSAGFLLISQNSAVLATDFRYTEQASAQAPEYEVVQINGGFTQWFPDLVSKVGVRKIAFESDDLSVTDYRELIKAARKLAPKARPTLMSDRGIVESLRAVKDQSEIELIEKAAILADSAVGYAVTVMKKGMTEKKLAWKLEKFLKDNGSENLPFEIIVASGPNAALPHAQPTEKTIRQGEPVVIDLGAKVEGYTSDITRTICMGKPSAKFVEVYQIVKQAQETALKGLKSGMTGGKADNLARSVIKQAKYGDKFGHSLGHGVGMETHENPRLAANSRDVLVARMVFTVEPGIYLPGWGGVRIEDMVLLEQKRPRVLTLADKADF